MRYERFGVFEVSIDEAFVIHLNRRIADDGAVAALPDSASPGLSWRLGGVGAHNKRSGGRVPGGFTG